MRRTGWRCAALALALSAVVSGAPESDDLAGDADGESVGLLSVQLGSSSDGGASNLPTELFVVAAASFGTPLTALSALLPLRVIRGGAGNCGLAGGDSQQQQVKGSAVVVERGAGGCSFVRQTLAAQRLGAALVVVRDSVAGAIAAAPTSAFDCALGAGFVDSNASFPLVTASSSPADEEEVAACAQTPTCLSQACVLTGRRLDDGPARFQVCCFRSHLLRMSVDSDARHLALAAAVRIPAVFLAYRDAERLEQLLLERTAAANASTPLLALVQAFSAEESPWNVSMALLWLLGVSVVTSAAYCSCTHERAFSYQKVASAFSSYSIDDASRDDKDLVYGSETELTAEEAEWGYVRIDAGEDGGDDRSDDDGRHGDDARLALTGRHAVLFLAGASFSLVLLYYVHDVMLLVNVLFAVGASAAITLVAFLPLAAALLPISWRVGSNKVLLASGALGLSVGAFWFLMRSSAYIWPLQNLLGIALCFLFIDTIHLPSLRVGTILLSVAFVYDVFFVYFSPFLFGSSVMVDVASGGGNARVVYGGSELLQLSQQYRDQAQPTPQQPQHETVPMVLSIPLLFSRFGGKALLGLGDLIVPGLLVAFCIRYDYCMGYPLSRSYFCVASVAYAVGLLLANTMAILLRRVVAGQPALMYIVPLLLTSVLGVAKWNGELETMWSGPPCLQMDVDFVTDAAADAGGRGETQPLVIAKVPRREIST